MPNVTSNRTVVAAAGTAVALSATPQPARCLIITPIRSNTNLVAIGGADTDATLASEKGVLLKPTDPALILYDVELSKVFVDAVTSGEGVSYSFWY